MKAVVTKGARQSAIKDVPKPEPKKNEVVVEVYRVQLSITECNYWLGDFGNKIQKLVEDLNGRIFGHEYAGVVHTTGTEVDQYKRGDRVYAAGKIPCLDCVMCSEGLTRSCMDGYTVGHQVYPGALAEFVKSTPSALYPLPEVVSMAEGAALQPLADAILSTHAAEIRPGDNVAIVGAGVMGLQTAQVSKWLGADKIYAIDRDERKVRLANQLDLIGINTELEEPKEVIATGNSGIGADIVFEAVGGAQNHMNEGSNPLSQAFQILRKRGKLVPIGIHTNDIQFNPHAMRQKAVKVIYPPSSLGTIQLGPNRDTGHLTSSLVESGRVSIKELITHELNGLDSIEKAIEITTKKDIHKALGPAQLILKQE